MNDVSTRPHSVPGRGFSEATVNADGFDIRYREAGAGVPLICLHGAGGLRLSGMHDLLAETHRVIAFEIPGFGASPANERSATMPDLAVTMNRAMAALDLERVNLMGTSFGAKLALWMAIAEPSRFASLVLISPAAIRPDAPLPGDGAPESLADLLYAHPERQPKAEPPPPEVVAKQAALVRRLIGPPRDEALEARLPEIAVPVLALFGTEDRMIPSTMAHHYRELLPNCHLMMVYDAAHAIDADRPEAVASVVKDFVARQDSFLVKEESGLIHP